MYTSLTKVLLTTQGETLTNITLVGKDARIPDLKHFNDRTRQQLVDPIFCYTVCRLMLEQLAVGFASSISTYKGRNTYGRQSTVVTEAFAE
jgi:hypothetical protein